MSNSKLVEKAARYLNTLCSAEPNRRTGSAGNREATRFFAQLIESFGYAMDTTPFECLDYVRGRSSLTSGDSAFEIHISPYSLACDVTSELAVVSTVQELERCECADRILLLRGDICAEPLMPKNFVFYNPDHHKRIYALLENKRPAAIITATAENPELVGALSPFPLIVDGDFNIPCAYCTDIVGQKIAHQRGTSYRLEMDARRIPATAANVVARNNPQVRQKVVVTAHIDAYEDAPGASDNASGTVVLLLVAELLKEYQGPISIEIVALNGEDHYSAGGQMDYLRRYDHEFSDIRVAINVDDVGYVKGRTAYSCYECPEELRRKVDEGLGGFNGIMEGESWFNGDHMMFVQKSIPAVAVTAEMMPELMKTVTHTSRDNPDLVDCAKLAELALALESLFRRL